MPDNLSYGASEGSLLHEEIRKVLSKAKAAGLLRLVFHDAGTFDKDDKTGIVYRIFIILLIKRKKGILSLNMTSMIDNTNLSLISN